MEKLRIKSGTRKTMVKRKRKLLAIKEELNLKETKFTLDGV
jgi:hypothetical protein